MTDLKKERGPKYSGASVGSPGSRTNRAIVRFFAIAGIAAGFFYVLGDRVDNHSQVTHIVKAVVALLAVALFFFEQRQKGLFRPISERWIRFACVALGLLSIVLYFNAFKLGYHKWYHRHDQFHYYMGSKYFPELGYSRLYKCSAIAQNDLGVVEHELENGHVQRINMTAEVQSPNRVLRDIGNTNLLVKASDVLAEPDKNCKEHFTPERWDMFKRDVAFFRIEAGKGYWEGMQKDHGYNPPPIWTLAGKLFAELAPASVNFMLFLGAIDIVYVLAMFAAVYWAFGYRVFAVMAILWGCESAADPYYWTGGAFLRQDWLVWSVLALCFARKRYFKLAAAAMVYAALLRIFPGLMVVGWLVVAGAHVWRHKRMHKDHKSALLGGTLAAALLIGSSAAVVGVDAYPAFYEHTLKVHDTTPLTNHMGLRVVVSHTAGVLEGDPVGVGKDSGRMKYTRNDGLTDPFKVWKEMRIENYNQYKWAAWLIRIGCIIAFFLAVTRIRLLWAAHAMSVVFVVIFAQLTNYYYGFLLCATPLILYRKNLELIFLGYTALTQVVYLNLKWNDDKYTLETVLALMLSVAILIPFIPAKYNPFRRNRHLPGKNKGPRAAKQSRQGYKTSTA